MPTYQQLQDEDAWQDEYAPQALKTLASRLEAHWPGSRCYIRGDNNHLRGYHRSRRWINESIYCTNRTYSVSRTAGDRSGGDSNWSCALDLTGLAQAQLHQACRNLDEACRAGRLEKITEWYGNLGNDGVVDGWDNIGNRPASSDSSHLTHLHMSFDRGRANDDHSDVLAILTGEDMSDIAGFAENANDHGWAITQLDPAYEVRPGNDSTAAKLTVTNKFVVAFMDLITDVNELVARPPVASAPVDIPALVAALTPALRTIVREELDKTGLAEL